MGFSIEVKDLKKSYGGVEALGGVTLSVPVGDFFGLLGPNGAGKTTLIRILTTLLDPTSGSVKVMGFDCVKERTAVREQIGVIPQAMTSDLDLTANETMDIYARFYGMGRKERKDRIDELLTMVGLTERANDLVATYSGGMRRRLEIARGLVHKPALLILDEPTIGLDPQSRHVVWELLGKFKKNDNMTMLLTTHYMDEAETLCDHVAIIDYGKIVVLDTVAGLKGRIPQKDAIELTVTGAAADACVEWVKGAANVVSCTVNGDVLIVYADNGANAIPVLVEGLKKLGAGVSRVTLKQQTLEDVFIHYTGRPMRDEAAKKVSFLLGAGIPAKLNR